MPDSYRLTQSGACASCGAYGGSQHRPTCGPRSGPRIKLGYGRQARRDARLSAVVRAHIEHERELERRL